MIDRNKQASPFLRLCYPLLLVAILFVADIRLLLPVESREYIKRNSVTTAFKHLNVCVYAVSCLACMRRIERKLRQTNGVMDVSVSVMPEVKMDITYNPKVVSEEAVFKIVAAEGYRVEKIKLPS